MILNYQVWQIWYLYKNIISSPQLYFHQKYFASSPCPHSWDGEQIPSFGAHTRDLLWLISRHDASRGLRAVEQVGLLSCISTFGRASMYDYWLQPGAQNEYLQVGTEPKRSRQPSPARDMSWSNNSSHRHPRSADPIGTVLRSDCLLKKVKIERGGWWKGKQVCSGCRHLGGWRTLVQRPPPRS